MAFSAMTLAPAAMYNSCLTANRSFATQTRSLKALRAPRSRVVVCAEKDLIEKASTTGVVPDVDRSNVSNVEAGNLSNENAEKRANIGQTRPPTFTEAQSFDGPAPETINGRLCMLAVTSALAAEIATGKGLKEQIAIAPIGILASFVIISLASYIPIFRGYTRKEAFANSFWSTKAENWNGRMAMVGFAGILVTEALSGKNTLEFWQSFFG